MSHYHALQDALKEFFAQDPVLMATSSGAAYDPGSGQFRLLYCNLPYTINHRSGAINTDNGEDVAVSDQILLYQYMAQAKGVPLAGRWISYLELPNGEHHMGPFKLEAIDPLAKTFGHNLKAFKKAASSLGGQEVKMGHAGFVIPALPRVPLAAILWEGDDEFVPSANLIFDASAASYLTPAALYVLGINVTRRMCGDKAF